jgi:ATP-dependent DNA helicase RecG
MRLQMNKGIVSFETETVSADLFEITNSEPIISFLSEVIPTAEPIAWLKKQQLIRNDKPTVAGVLLFAEEPQAIIPKRCAIKIYRYKTTDAVGSRDTLAFNPITMDGCIYDQIHASVNKTVEVVQSISKLGIEGLEKITYPLETLHEIITNAVLHRDYSIADDVHVRIFDNRIEIESPGKLPGHVTVNNILKERFARNGNVVRLINKFPDPPNKDVGEGLNTAFEAMRKLKLKEPVIEQRENSLIVYIRHELLASPEEIIINYLEKNPYINNSKGREICHIGSENVMKRILQRLVDRGLIERVPERKGKASAYQKK